MSCTMTTAARAVFAQGTSHVQVHFDDACVLIPDPIAQSRMPRLVKKTYSLPLWRRRSNSNFRSDPESTAVASSSEDKGVVFTVPVPSFSKSRSPSRGEHLHQPLVPCLVDASNPGRHERRPSLPLPTRPDAVTVPLRPCCAECYPVTEECLKEGEQWQEKFTRGARRRRNSSAGTHTHYHALRHRIVRDELPGFGAVVSVDEVDRRHGISRTASTGVPQASEEEESEESLMPSLTRRLQTTELSPAPVEETDEGFPLPSPRRFSMDIPSASSSHFLQTDSGDMRLMDLQGRGEIQPEQTPTVDADQFGDAETDPARATIYYTPESSPTLPSLEPSHAFASSPRDEDITPPTPLLPTPFPTTSTPIAIPGAQDRKTFFSNLSLSSFELVNSPGMPSPPLPFSSNYHDRYSASTASPELTDFVPALHSSSPARKRFMHLPNLPGPGSFLRAGADMFRGVGVLAPGVSPIA